MKTYKFDTRISKNGTIQIPLSPALYNREVEIIIVPKSDDAPKKETKAVDFVKKWAGFLKDFDTDNSKYNYLKNKYK